LQLIQEQKEKYNEEEISLNKGLIERYQNFSVQIEE
jgi:hypothetical protein